MIKIGSKRRIKKTDILFIIFAIASILFLIGLFVYDSYKTNKQEKQISEINKQLASERNMILDKKEDLTKQINEIENEVKPCVLLNFDDQSNNYRKRYTLVKEQYGFNATFAIKTFENTNINYMKYMIDNGWDCAIYGGVNGYPGKENVNNENYTETWKNFVQPLYDEVIANGFNPTAYFCPNNACGDVFEEVLLNMGFKMVRSRDGSDSTYITACRNVNGITGTTYIGSNNVDEIKKQIDTCIKNKWCLPIFTHLLVDDINEDRGYDTLTSTYIEMLDYIKEKVDNGELEVLTYKEYYEKMSELNARIEPLQKELDSLE